MASWGLEHKPSTQMICGFIVGLVVTSCIVPLLLISEKNAGLTRGGVTLSSTHKDLYRRRYRGTLNPSKVHNNAPNHAVVKSAIHFEPETHAKQHEESLSGFKDTSESTSPGGNNTNSHEKRTNKKDITSKNLSHRKFHEQKNYKNIKYRNPMRYFRIRGHPRQTRVLSGTKTPHLKEDKLAQDMSLRRVKRTSGSLKQIGFSDTCITMMWSDLPFTPKNFSLTLKETRSDKGGRSSTPKYPVAAQYTHTECNLLIDHAYEVTLNISGQSAGEMTQLQEVMTTTHRFPLAPKLIKLVDRTHTTLTLALPKMEFYEGPRTYREVRLKPVAVAPSPTPFIKPGMRVSRDTDHVILKGQDEMREGYIQRFSNFFSLSFENVEKNENLKEDIATNELLEREMAPADENEDVITLGNLMPLEANSHQGEPDAEGCPLCGRLNRKKRQAQNTTALPSISVNTTAQPGTSVTTTGQPGTSVTTTGQPGISVTTTGQPGISVTTNSQPGISSNNSGTPSPPITVPGSLQTPGTGIIGKTSIATSVKYANKTTQPTTAPTCTGLGTPSGRLVWADNKGNAREITIGIFHSKRLEPGTQYEVVLYSMSKLHNNKKYSCSSVMVKTLSDPESSLLWNILAILFAILCLILIFVAMFFLIRKVYKRKQQKKSLKLLTHGVYTPVIQEIPEIPKILEAQRVDLQKIPEVQRVDLQKIPEVQRVDLPLPQKKDTSEPEKREPEKHWSPIYNVTDRRFMTSKRENIPGDSWVKASALTSQPSANRSRVTFREEFYNLPDSRRDWSRNNPRFDDRSGCKYLWNRFPHIPFMEETRVVLCCDASSRNTYINANFIAGYSNQNDPCPHPGVAYIAAASPFDTPTALDFWRMIQQQGVETVVTLTNVVEEGVVKCAQFWPCCGQTVHTLGHLLLQTVEERSYVHYTVRKIKYRSNCEQKCCEITQFQFTSWPRQGAPESPVPFLELRQKVRGHHGSRQSPILVHCGTGVTRTASFIGLDIAIDQYEADGDFSMFEIVSRMREQRPMMVRCVEQYAFIYSALSEDFEAGNTTVRLSDGLYRQREELSEVNPRTGRTWLYDQFDLLDFFTQDILAEDIATLREMDGRVVNPYGKYPQDYLHPEINPLQKYAIINPVFVDGFRQKRAFALLNTQICYEFWQFVDENNVIAIIYLGDPREAERGMDGMKICRSTAKSKDSKGRRHTREAFVEDEVAFRTEPVSLTEYDGIFIRDLRLEKSQTVGGERKASMRRIRQFSVPYASLACPPKQNQQLSDNKGDTKDNIRVGNGGGNPDRKQEGFMADGDDGIQKEEIYEENHNRNAQINIGNISRKNSKYENNNSSDKINNRWNFSNSSLDTSSNKPETKLDLGQQETELDLGHVLDNRNCRSLVSGTHQQISVNEPETKLDLSHELANNSFGNLELESHQQLWLKCKENLKTESEVSMPNTYQSKESWNSFPRLTAGGSTRGPMQYWPIRNTKTSKYLRHPSYRNRRRLYRVPMHLGVLSQSRRQTNVKGAIKYKRYRFNRTLSKRHWYIPIRLQRHRHFKIRPNCLSTPCVNRANSPKLLGTLKKSRLLQTSPRTLDHSGFCFTDPGSPAKGASHSVTAAASAETLLRCPSMKQPYLDESLSPSPSGATGNTLCSLCLDTESPLKYRSREMEDIEKHVSKHETERHSINEATNCSTSYWIGNNTNFNYPKDTDSDIEMVQQPKEQAKGNVKSRHHEQTPSLPEMTPGKALEMLEIALDWQAKPLRDWYLTQPRAEPPPKVGPVVIQAPEESNIASLLCACALTCERAQEENLVDIYHTVKELRRKLPHSVNSFAQYELIWDALCNYATDYQDNVQFSDRWKYRGIKDKVIVCPAIEEHQS